MSLARVWHRATGVPSHRKASVGLGAFDRVLVPRPLAPTPRLCPAHSHNTAASATPSHTRSHTRSFASWRNPFATISSSSASGPADVSDPIAWAPNLGVYGCPLREPADFARLQQKAVEICNGHIATIASLPPSIEVLSLTDTISQLLCAVADAAELCKVTHPSSAWRDAATEASAQIGGFIAELNHSPVLYSAITAMRDAPGMSPEAQRVRMLLQRDMDAQGIGASEKNRAIISALLGEVHEQTSVFSALQFGDGDSSEQLRVRTDHASKLGSAWSSYSRRRGDTFVLPMNAAPTLIRAAPDGDVRRQAYEQFTGERTIAEHKRALERVVLARQMLARVFGASSFAAHTIGLCVAQDEGHVRRVLTRILEELQPERNAKTRSELDSLKREKYYDLHQQRGVRLPPFAELSAQQRAEIAQVKLQPWDQMYYMGRVKASVFESSIAATLPHYFSVPNVLEGWRLLCQQLFGLELRTVDMAPGESWVAGNELTKLELWEPAKASSGDSLATESRLLGVIYLDLYERPNKFSHAASFNVRSACELLNGERQLPVVGIVCALPRPTWRAGVHTSQEEGSTSPMAGARELTLLGHSDVEMLFHEFGHCLHNLFSLTRFQHVAGARGELDFVEMPSTLFEHFASEHAFVSQWARHYRTGEPMPASLLADVRRAKNAFHNCDLITQALFSLYDQHVHGAEMSRATPEELGPHMAQVFQQLHRSYSPFHHDDTPQTHSYTRMLHLTTYAASYYCYLYCRIFSSLIWSQSFAASAAGPMQRALGERLRTHLFAQGGAKDARLILADLAGLDARQLEADPNALQKFVEAQVANFIRADAGEAEAANGTVTTANAIAGKSATAEAA